jgi:hypothetical protein
MISTKTSSWLLAVLFCCLLGNAASAQEESSGTVNSAGGSFSNDKFTIDWSLGELLKIDTRISVNEAFMVSQGLLQPSYTTPIIFVRDPSFAKGDVKILPNPVKSILQVQFTLRQIGRMRCMLYTEKGERLFETAFAYYGYGYTQNINMSKYPNGNYFLYVELEPVMESTIRKGSFKVLKID